MKGRIGIVGGSIAGCAAALAASRAGYAVTIFERATHLRDRGFGVGMQLTTHDELVAAGYLGRDLPIHPVTHRLWIVAEPGEPGGRVLWRQPAPALATNWGLLWTHLRDQVAPFYLASEHVAAVDRDGIITTRDGRTRTFDLIIGADGHHSLVRSAISADAHPRDAGYALWRGVVADHLLPKHIADTLASSIVTVVFKGGHAIFYLIPSGDGGRLLMWAVYARPREPHRVDPGEVWETAEHHLPPDWAAVCRNSPDVYAHPVTDMTAATYISGSELLIGDAATLPRPHTAAGASKAMLDAACLERALAPGVDLTEALAQYDTARRAAGNQLVEIGRRIGAAMVERTPDWSSMTPADMPTWMAGMLAGQDHYLYRSPPRQAG